MKPIQRHGVNYLCDGCGFIGIPRTSPIPLRELLAKGLLPRMCPKCMRHEWLESSGKMRLRLIQGGRAEITEGA